MAESEARYRLSRAAQGVPPSLMTDLAELIARPGIISFANGLPPNECLPVRELADCAHTVLAQDGAKALQYAPMYPPLREWLAAYMRGRGVECQPENIFITTGAQQALALLAELFLDPGDVAVLERVTYVGFWQVVLKREARPRVLHTDLESGLDLQALEAALSEPPRPRLALVIPDFHNPLGISLSEEQRKGVAELAARYGVTVIEDDTYSPLRVEGEQLPPIKAYDRGGRVIYCGSFSKLVAPALRLGWIVAPTFLIPHLHALRETLDLQASALSQRLLVEFFRRRDLEHHLRAYRERLRERRDAMLQALDTHFLGLARWSRPQGGFFIWVELAARLDSLRLLEAAVEEGVAFVPGQLFTDGSTRLSALRLSYSNVSPEEIQDGLQRLASVIRRWS